MNFDFYLSMAIKRLISRLGLTILFVLSASLAVGMAACVPVFSGAVSRRIIQQELGLLEGDAHISPFTVRFYASPSARRPLSLDDIAGYQVWLADLLLRRIGVPSQAVYTEVHSPRYDLIPQAGDTRYTEAFVDRVFVVWADRIEEQVQVRTGAPFGDAAGLEVMSDRVVSVGMMEHVGASELGTYFNTVRNFMKPDGVALIHSITAMEPPGITSPFTRKYIFPGGYSPSMSETLSAIEEANLWLLDCEIWRKHYAYTIREWSRRFAASRDAAKAIYDERFCRMWEFYLAGAETAFLADTLAVMQLQIGRERDAVPLSRDYIAVERERLQVREAKLVPA